MSQLSTEERNALRQFLMNDLGLSRQLIREEMMAIVEETVQRHFASMDFENVLAGMVRTQFKALQIRRPGEWATILSTVDRIAVELVKAWVKDHLRFDVTEVSHDQ